MRLLKERWFRQRPIIDLRRKAGVEEEETVKDTVKKKRHRRTRSEWYYRRQRRSINYTQSFSYQVLMDTSFRLFFRSKWFNLCSWSAEAILEVQKLITSVKNKPQDKQGWCVDTQRSSDWSEGQRERVACRDGEMKPGFTPWKYPIWETREKQLPCAEDKFHLLQFYLALSLILVLSLEVVVWIHFYSWCWYLTLPSSLQFSPEF